MKRKKLNNFFYQKNGFQLANQPRKKNSKRKTIAKEDSSNWHFVLTPFTAQWVFVGACFVFLKKQKKKNTTTPITENTERGQKPPQIDVGTSFSFCSRKLAQKCCCFDEAQQNVGKNFLPQNCKKGHGTRSHSNRETSPEGGSLTIEKYFNFISSAGASNEFSNPACHTLALSAAQ